MIGKERGPMRALLIGGTGPTGPDIARGLKSRGYETTILHRGSHEIDDVADFEHIHADPHFEGELAAGLLGRTFDVAVVTYGRLRHVAIEVARHTNRLVSVGGTAYARQRWSTPITETALRDLTTPLTLKIQQTEEAIFECAARTGLNLTHIRYPYLYGARQLAPREWSIIRRILDGRHTIPVVDGGLSQESKAYSENAAHAVLLAVDTPDSAGKIYHVSDELTPTDGERAHAIARAMGTEIELVNYPREVSQPAWFWFAGRTLGVKQKDFPITDHSVLDISRAKAELGYRDLVDFDEAIQRTVDWYLEHPSVPGGDIEARLGDQFDYVAEDRFRLARRRFVDDCAAIPILVAPTRHAYDHPPVQKID
ncbi:NAD-dependent dehydratase [Cryobacterium glaciale]|uniref:NAD-dependent dehydratase n=1 Tax=Cryobacterium glaciale TaxID=1259145 RepID=A0A4R8V5R9_9MICO|nr:NAD-dependent epimerase/dehydratase family protein [Cryobacterium glaciale]TFB77304.1 NAD-dependent dehydratase [Cryobacterium glaciale]